MKNYINKYSFLCLLLSAAEQLLVAASTMCMVKMGECIARKSDVVLWSVIFIVTLFVVFIPRYGYERFLILAKYETLRSFVTDFENALQDKPFLIKEKEFANQRKTFFHNETWNVVNETYEFGFDFIMTSLNIVFQVTVLGLVIKREFFPAYLSAFFIAFLFCSFSKKKAEALTLKAQEAHVSMNNLMLWGWDTILSGNPYNNRLWNHSFNEQRQESVQKNIRKLKYLNCMSGVTMLISSIPIVGFLISILLFENDIETRTALLITLPRQVNTIQNLNIFIMLLMSWNGIYAKGIGLKHAISVPETFVFQEMYIHFDQLTFWENGASFHFQSLKDISAWLQQKQTGRITIRGGNGVGKTTLLLGLKTHFKDHAYYFSPNMAIYFSNSVQQSLSTGKLILSHLEEIFEHIESGILLLDEWDANLDTENLAEIDAFIEELGAKLCVVEIRHRK